MKRFLLSTTLAGVTLFAGFQAFSDDMSASQPPASRDAMVKDCVAKHHASDSSKSMDDIKHMCEVKAKNTMDPTGTNKVPAAKPDQP